MRYSVLLIPFLSALFLSCADRICSDDLRESGPLQSRDLSTPGSRIVLNPYNFNLPASTTVSMYSNSDVLPLNAGYLTMKCSDRDSLGRFGREYRDIFQVRRLGSDGKAVPVSSYGTEWLPYGLPFSASYKDGNVLSGYDTFSSDSVVVRRIEADSPVTVRISGRIRGTVSGLEDDGTVIVDCADCRYAVKVAGVQASSVKFHVSEDDVVSGAVADSPETAGFWSVDVADMSGTDMAVAFSLPMQSDRDLHDAVKAALDKGAAYALESRKKFWDDFLRHRVPHPSDFSLEDVDAHGVTAEDAGRLYYKAWVALAQNVLVPEGDEYPYWQVAAGKASLWDEGHPTAPFSAAWESFVGMQMYAHIDTDIAWSCLKGLLSLVDETGMLGGESLPSRKAHTAWVLYRLSEDRASLEEVYPALERYIDWRLTQPRWIYNGMTAEDEKDAEFVVSVIVDMDYMTKIARVLGKDDAAGMWQKKRSDYIRNWYRWFWKTPDSLPVQFADNWDGRGGFPVQITSGLVIPELDGEYLDSMMKLFYAIYDPSKPFAGFEAPKYPDVDFTVYGLLADGKDMEAKVIMESFIRDVARSGVFAETYFNRDGMPEPSGVRPSIFGLAGVIDFTVLKDGKQSDFIR